LPNAFLFCPHHPELRRTTPSAINRNIHVNPAEARNAMLSRISINVVLKTVIAVLGTALVVALSLGAWDSWSRLIATQRADAVAETSKYLFTALNHLRIDRTTSRADLLSDTQLTAMDPQLGEARDGEMPALQSALVALQRVDLPDRDAVIAELADRIKRLSALHDESAAALLQPKAARPPGLADEMFKEADDLLKFIDQLSSRLTASIKLQDAFIDQMMEIKDLAWLTRNTGGDEALVAINVMNGRPLPANAMDQYLTYDAKTNADWALLKAKASSLPLPAAFNEAIAKADQVFFDPDFAARRLKIVKALIAGQPPGVSSEAWSKESISRNVPLVEVANAALDAASDHCAAQHASALRDLILQLVLLVGAVAAVVGMMLMVTRRVINPLHQLSAAMHRLASGDFSAVLPGLGRGDEIGEIAAATEGFKVKAAEKAQREAAAQADQQRQAAEKSQREAAAQAAERADQDRRTATERDAAMARLSSEFEVAVGGIVQAAVKGDFTQRVAVAGKSGLVLNVGSAINTLCENVSSALDDLADMLGALADGDLTRRIAGDYQGRFATLKDNANTTAERVGGTIAQIKQAGQEVASAAAEISASTTDLSRRTEEQAASLEETSASMEEMAATVKKNAENAKLASQFASETQSMADRSGQVVAAAVNAMSRIDESSRKIVDIITVIDEIARQTNLLALNAAVEAARAGDAGRGFAVVAAEVRSLAQRSSQAAKDIKDLITNSGSQVKDGVDLVNRTGASLGEIVASIKKVVDLVADIATASAEQATGIDQVNKALTQVDQLTQQNSALVEENAATAKTLEQQATVMNDRVGAFQLNQVSQQAQPARPAPLPEAAARRYGSRVGRVSVAS
jgi:methyl-accepting chemotaxis protein